jgi:hypothetical protein
VAGRLVALAHALGVKPEWIANVVQMESGWNVRAVNTQSGASGLIQFTTTTARELGTSVDAIRRMNIVDQWTLVERYFTQLPRIPKPLRSQLDVFMAVYYAPAVGRGAGFVIGSEVSAAHANALAAMNNGIRTAQDYYDYAVAHAKLG